MNNKRSWAGILILLIDAAVFVAEHVVRGSEYRGKEIVAYVVFGFLGFLLLDPTHAVEIAKMAKDKLPGLGGK